MNRRRVIYWILLVLAAVLALCSAIPVADVPVRVYDSAAAIAPAFAFGCCSCAWGSLLFSPRKPLHWGLSAGLTMFAIGSLCRDVWALLACCTYYVTG